MRIIILKILRAAAVLPLLLYLGYAVYSGIFGVSFFMDSFSIGFDAVYLVLLVGVVGFWWLWLICIVLIIFTSVLIRKQLRKNREQDAGTQ